MDRASKATEFKNALLYILLFLGVQLVCSTATISIARLVVGAEEAVLFSQNFTTLTLLISEILTLAVLVFICKWKKQSSSVFLGEDNDFNSQIVPFLIFAGFFGNVFTSAFMNFLPFSQETLNNYSNGVGALTSSIFIADILAVAIFAPIVEEIIFRGLVLSKLRLAMPVWAAVALQAVVFGLIHGTLVWIIYATIFGAVLGYVRIATGSIKASIVMHIAFNASSFFIWIIFMYMPNTRAVQGIIALVCGAIMVFVLSRIKRK